MNIFITLITTPLGYILGWIYEFVQNYGVAVILFTVLIKLILLPLGLKQQKSMTKMQKIQPKLKEIQDKYQYDQQKSSQEMMKLYKEYGVNPTGGCLPLLVQFPIIIGLYNVIYKPLTYMLHYGADKVAALQKAHNLTGAAAARSAEILIAKGEKLLNFDFFGLDLSVVPNDVLKQLFAGKTGIIALTVLIIPILATLTTVLTSKITTYINKPKDGEKKNDEPPKRVLSPDQKTAESGQSAEAMTKSMTYVMPIMTLWFTLTLPSTLGLYWTISNIVSLAQTVLLNGYYNKKLTDEIAKEDIVREQKLLEKQKKYNIQKKKKRG